MSVDYSNAEKARERIIRQRQASTYKAFERMRARIDNQISNMNMSTVSERVKRQQLEEIRYQLQKSLSSYYSALEDGYKSDMKSVGEAVLSDSEAFYRSLNMPVSMAITSFPTEIMESIVSGSVYKERWYLSQALWGDYKDKLNDINEIVMQGVGLNLSSLEIAKQLEQFVDPSAMKPSKTIVTPCLQDPKTGKLYSMDYVKRHPEMDWSGFKEKKSRFNYGKVDYNAQRLARTLVSHAYQQNIVRQAQANPFASGVKWEASGGERMCELCEERDGKIFPVDDVPLDHPNGMCTFSVETPSMMEMSDALADWVKGEPTDWDDQLNAYYEGRPIDHKITLQDTQGRRIVVDGKDIADIWKRRPDEFDFAIEDVINAQGFDGLPRVVSADEFDKLVKESNFIAQRGYRAEDQETLDMYRDMLYNGKWYVDCSEGGDVYGKGMYAGYNDGTQISDIMEKISKRYGSSRGDYVGYVETFTLAKDSKFIEFEDARKLAEEYRKSWQYGGSNYNNFVISEINTFGKNLGLNSQEKAYLCDRFFDVEESGFNSRKWWNELSEKQQKDFEEKTKGMFSLRREMNRIIDSNFDNIGVGEYAAMKGYDAIKVPDRNFVIILNRTKVIIKEP